MPPAAVKTVRDVIYWQYAAIMTGAATGHKNEGALRMSFLSKLKSGEIVWSTNGMNGCWKKKTQTCASIAAQPNS